MVKRRYLLGSKVPNILSELKAPNLTLISAEYDVLDGVDLTHELVVAIKQLDGLVRPLLIAVLVNV